KDFSTPRENTGLTNVDNSGRSTRSSRGQARDLSPGRSNRIAHHAHPAADCHSKWCGPTAQNRSEADSSSEETCSSSAPRRRIFAHSAHTAARGSHHNFHPDLAVHSVGPVGLFAGVQPWRIFALSRMPRPPMPHGAVVGCVDIAEA